MSTSIAEDSWLRLAAQAATLVHLDEGELLTEAIQRFERWRATRAPADLELSIVLFADLDAVVRAGHALRFWADLLAALALADRYELNDSIDDLDGVIERLKRILADPSPPQGLDQDDVDAYRVALGRALANRIGMYGRPDGPPSPGDAEFLAELRTAIDALGVAATTSSELVTPTERAEAAALRAHLVPKLVLTRAIVGRKAGELADIRELERVLREVPADHPNRPQILLELGFAYMHLILRPGSALSSSGTSEHRVLAARYLSQAVEVLDTGYPERAKAIAFLAYLDVAAVTHQADGEAPKPHMQMRRRLAVSAFRWMLAPASLAVLQSSHEVLRDEAQGLVEAELDRAYVALGPPPGLNESDLERWLDDERS